METVKIIDSSNNNSQVNKNPQGNPQENPQIYSTVFQGHITSVFRPNKQENKSLTPQSQNQSIV